MVPDFLTGLTTEQLLKFFKYGKWAKNSAHLEKASLLDQQYDVNPFSCLTDNGIGNSRKGFAILHWKGIDSEI